MKKESNFILYVFIAVAVIGVGLYALLVPKSYNWSTYPTNLNSEEPFAQKVMHDVLSHSFSHGYRVSDDLDSTLKQQEKNNSNENLIVFASSADYAEENNLEQLHRMARLARNGRRIVYTTHITSNIDHSFFGLTDNLDGGDWQLDLNDAKNVPKGKKTLLPFPLIYDNEQIDMSEKGGRETVFDCMIGTPFVSLNTKKAHNTLAFGHRQTGAQDILIPMSSLQFEGTAQGLKKSIATYRPQTVRVVLCDEDGNIYGLRYEFASGGSITWIAGGAMFTNYGFSVSQWRGLARPLLADLDNRPVCFVNAIYKDKTDDAQQDDYNTPFSFFIERPPLRLALWIPIGMAILALLFNTRRRFRAERYLPRVRNSSLAFARQLSTLFKNKHNYTPLVRNELHLLLDLLRNEYRFERHDCLADYAPQIAERDTRGLLPHDNLAERLAQLDGLLDTENRVPFVTRSQFQKYSHFTQLLLAILQSQPNT